METIASLLVGKPLNILAVAAVFLLGHFIRKRAGSGPGRHPRALLAAACAWAAYAAWEGLVVTLTPEANIRVDLMLIWPVVLIVSIWSAIRALRKANPGAGVSPGNS